MPADLVPTLALTGGVLLAMAFGLGAGILAHRILKRHNEIGRLGDTIGFVGGAFGILLGLMIVFAAEHFQLADHAAREEAVASVALFQALTPFPEPERSEVRHSVVCLMRSAIAEDWPATVARDMTGAENTNRWALAVQNGVKGLPQETDAQAQAYYFVSQELLARGKARQDRLLLSQPEIPVLVWIAIFVSTFVFCWLLAFHLADRPWLLGLAMLSTALLLVALTGTLSMLDYPFGWGPAVEPDAMASALLRLESVWGGSPFQPCAAPPPAAG